MQDTLKSAETFGLLGVQAEPLAGGCIGSAGGGAYDLQCSQCAVWESPSGVAKKVQKAQVLHYNHPNEPHFFQAVYAAI